MSRVRTAVLVLILVVGVAGSSLAETSKAAADPWLEKLAAISDTGPFSLGFTAALDLTGFGQPMKAGVKGSYRQRDRTHHLLNLAVDVESMQTADGQPAILIKSVADGSFVWSELSMFGVVSQVSKTDLDSIAPPIGVGANPLSFDPFRQLQTFSEMMDVEVVELGDEQVTLRGTWSEGADSGPLLAAGVTGFEFVLDRDSGFPVSLSGLPEPAFLVLHFEKVERLAADAFAADDFDYTPPPGLPVADQTSSSGQADSSR